MFNIEQSGEGARACLDAGSAPTATLAVPMTDNQLTKQETLHFQVLRLLEQRPDISQRDLAQELGVSLGKTNFCIRALLDKGLIKLANFRRNPNKLAYSYLITPAGISAKAAITTRFLRRKMDEYEKLKAEIESLQREGAETGSSPRASPVRLKTSTKETARRHT